MIKVDAAAQTWYWYHYDALGEVLALSKYNSGTGHAEFVEKYTAASKNCFSGENERNSLRQGGRAKIAAGVAIYYVEDDFGPTTRPVRIAAVRSQNEFLEGA